MKYFQVLYKCERVKGVFLRKLRAPGSLILNTNGTPPPLDAKRPKMPFTLEATGTVGESRQIWGNVMEVIIISHSIRLSPTLLLASRVNSDFGPF